MTLDKILIDIEEGKIHNGTMMTGGDLFYDLVVIDKSLYVINTTTKDIVLLPSKNIERYIKNKDKFYIYKQILD